MGKIPPRPRSAMTCTHFWSKTFTPDVPDSEARGISHFPRVDDLVSFPETCVKGLKAEVWMVGVVEAGDYVTCLGLGNQFFEAQLGHPSLQHSPVRLVPGHPT